MREDIPRLFIKPGMDADEIAEAVGALYDWLYGFKADIETDMRRIKADINQLKEAGQNGD